MFIKKEKKTICSKYVKITVIRLLTYRPFEKVVQTLIGIQ